jgi:hypothetical protein
MEGSRGYISPTLGGTVRVNFVWPKVLEFMSQYLEDQDII